MSDKLIVYPNQTSNSLMLLIPTGELPLDVTAKKDVPSGVPYLIVDRADLPEDFDFFAAWEASFDKPVGYGADWGIGSTKGIAGWTENFEPILEEYDHIQ